MGSVETVPGRIRVADPGEGERLREIAIAAKGYWGYDPQRVRDWAAMVDFSPAGLGRKKVFVVEVEGRAAGWAALIDQRQAPIHGPKMCELPPAPVTA